MNYESKFSWLGIFDDMTSMFTTSRYGVGSGGGADRNPEFHQFHSDGDHHTKRKEFAMLESIGMTSGQLKS